MDTSFFVLALCCTLYCTDAFPQTDSQYLMPSPDSSNQTNGTSGTDPNYYPDKMAQGGGSSQQDNDYSPQSQTNGSSRTDPNYYPDRIAQSQGGATDNDYSPQSQTNASRTDPNYYQGTMAQSQGGASVPQQDNNYSPQSQNQQITTSKPTPGPSSSGSKPAAYSTTKRVTA